MSPHYHCTYRHAHNEARLYYRDYWLCPWPRLNVAGVLMTDLKRNSSPLA